MNQLLKTTGLIAVIALFLLTSCKKQSDDNAPVIIISGPVENSSYNSEDSIPVGVVITDDEIIKSVRVSLVTTGLETMPGSVKYFTPGTRSASYNFDLIINNQFIESGIYYVQVTASDGTNTSNAYRLVQVIGPPCYLQGLVILSQTSSINVNLLDTLYNISSLFETEGDYIASMVQSKYRKIYIAGRDFLNLEAWNADNHQLEWVLEPDINTPYHTQDCLFADDDLYVTFGRYFFRRYSANGQVRFTTQVSEMETPGNIIRAGEYVLVERQGTGVFDSKIGCYYAETGMLYNQAQIYYEIVYMLPLDDAEVALICSSSNGNSIKVYDIEEGKVYDKFLLPQGDFNFCEGLPGGKILCGIGQDVYEIFSDPGFYSSVPKLAGIEMARYEIIRNTMYVVSGNEIRVYSYPDYSLLHTSLVSSDVLNIHLLYNR